MNLWNNANDLRHGQQPTGARMTQLLTKNDKTKYGHLPLEALEVWLPNMSFRPQVTMLYRLASSILTAESWENESRGSCKGFNRLAPTRVPCHHPSWSTSQWKSSHQCNHTLLESKESQYRSIWINMALNSSPGIVWINQFEIHPSSFDLIQRHGNKHKKCPFKPRSRYVVDRWLFRAANLCDSIGSLLHLAKMSLILIRTSSISISFNES